MWSHQLQLFSWVDSGGRLQGGSMKPVVLTIAAAASAAAGAAWAVVAVAAMAFLVLLVGLKSDATATRLCALLAALRGRPPVHVPPTTPGARRLERARREAAPGRGAR